MGMGRKCLSLGRAKRNSWSRLTCNQSLSGLQVAGLELNGSHVQVVQGRRAELIDDISLVRLLGPTLGSLNRIAPGPLMTIVGLTP